MNLRVALVLAVLVVGAGAAAIIMHDNGTSPEIPGPAGGGRNVSGGSPAGPGEAAPAGWSVWDFYASSPRLYVEPYPEPYGGGIAYWPVLVAGRFYGVSHITISYNFSLNNVSVAGLRIRYSLEPNQTFTAACADINNTVLWSRKVSGLLRVDETVNMSDGNWIRFTIYVNRDYFIVAADPLAQLDPLPDPTAALNGILGGVVSTSTGSIRWSWIVGADPSNDSLALECRPYKVESGSFDDVLAVSSTIRWIEGHLDVPLFSIIPEELFSRDAGLLENLTSLRQARSMTINDTGNFYRSVNARLEPLGPASLPGTSVMGILYRIDFSTEPDVVHGYYIISNETAFPLEYHLELYAGGDYVGVDYRVEEMGLLETWTAPASG